MKSSGTTLEILLNVIKLSYKNTYGKQVHVVTALLYAETEGLRDIERSCAVVKYQRHIEG